MNYNSLKGEIKIKIKWMASESKLPRSGEISITVGEAHGSLVNCQTSPEGAE